eukprot:1005054_1
MASNVVVPNQNGFSNDIYDGPLPEPSAALLLERRPTAPSMLYSSRNKQTFALPISQVDFNIEFHVSTAFGKLNAVWVNSSNQKINAIFAFPLKGTVTSVNIRIGKERLLETAVISNDDAKKYASEKDVSDNPLGQYIPDLFRLPVPNIAPGDQIFLEATFLEPLEIRNGKYQFLLPMRFGQNVIPTGVPRDQIVRIHCSINCVVAGISYESSTHTLTPVADADLRTELVATGQWAGSGPDGVDSDFHLAYAVPAREIVGALICSAAPPGHWDPRGTFCLFLTPPVAPAGMFGRDIVFLVDRSGSMHGEPFNEAARGIEFAFGQMHEFDRFNVIMFDHEQIELSTGGTLLPFTPETKQMALQFVNANQPRGLTDIATPLFGSIALLKNLQMIPSFSSNVEVEKPVGVSRLPFVVLITDGAVSDEREICRRALQECGPVRVLTFGIGTYCNWYFLKMLSSITRGQNMNAAYKEELYPRMCALMEGASAPVLRDIKVVGLPRCEVYPFPVPDLFIGSPLTIAGKFSGDSLLPVAIQGTMWDGQLFEIQFSPSTSERIPIDKVFLKQRIDLMTAQQWLNESAVLKDEIVQVSTQESSPSNFTTMVAYETTPSKKEKEKKNKKHGSGAVSGATVAALAVGGIVAIGAAAFIFGDVGATAANAISGAAGGLDGLADFGGFDVDTGCCEGCYEALTCGGCEGCGECDVNCFEGCDGCECPDCPDCSQCFEGIACCFSCLAECGQCLFECLGGLGECCAGAC